MAQWLEASDEGFEEAFTGLLAAKREQSADVDDTVRDIIAQVRTHGDNALIALTQKFDRHTLTPDTMAVSKQETARALADCDPSIVASLEFAAERIRAYHARQMPAGEMFTDAAGVELGHRWTPVSDAGIYVPGGLAAYPSSVLMNAIPARVAGAGRLVMVVPMPGGVVNPLVLAAAAIAGADEIYKVGGAQAIAALAYGTATIAPVHKIAGPGNAYVAAAKRQVFGTVGIDMIAGPSEVLIIAGADNNPDWIAADLLAQAEHDTAAQSILISDDAAFGRAVAAAVERQLKTLTKADIAGASWRDFGTIIVVDELDDAVALADRIAPEHLEIASDDPQVLADKISHAGSIFLGRHTPEAVGDYVAGPNHVLPTARSARYSSGLSVLDFMKRTSLLKCSADALAAIGPAAVTLGRAEGLDGHARAVQMRLNKA